MKIVALVIMLVFSFSFSHAGEVRVVEVVNGDTILIHDGRVREIGIAGIAAPRLDQPFGNEAARHLEALLSDGIYLDQIRVNQSGRTTAEVTLPGGRSLAWVLVEEGIAWCDNKFNRSNPLERPQDPLCLEEEKARKAGIGLWAHVTTPPWSLGDTSAADLDLSRAAMNAHERRIAAEEAAAAAREQKLARDAAMRDLATQDPQAAALLRIEEQNRKIMQEQRRQDINNIFRHQQNQERLRNIEWDR